MRAIPTDGAGRDDRPSSRLPGIPAAAGTPGGRCLCREARLDPRPPAAKPATTCTRNATAGKSTSDGSPVAAFLMDRPGELRAHKHGRPASGGIPVRRRTTDHPELVTERHGERGIESAGPGVPTMPEQTTWRQVKPERIPEGAPFTKRLSPDTSGPSGRSHFIGSTEVVRRWRRPAGEEAARTTVPAPAGHGRPSDLLERDFTVGALNRRRVADITMPGRRVALPNPRLFSISLPGWCRLAGRGYVAGRAGPRCPGNGGPGVAGRPCHRVTDVTTATMKWLPDTTMARGSFQRRMAT